jgi:hypothetical protein
MLVEEHLHTIYSAFQKIDLISIDVVRKIIIVGEVGKK